MNPLDKYSDEQLRNELQLREESRGYAAVRQQVILLRDQLTRWIEQDKLIAENSLTARYISYLITVPM